MKCPRCHSAMKDVRGVALCASCGGAFVACAAVDTVRKAFDDHAQSMAELAAQHARSLVVDVTGHAACPACGVAMQRFRVGPVEVDTCFTHGSWYDRGELRQVRDALAAGAMTSEVTANAPAPAGAASPADLAADAFGPAPAAPAPAPSRFGPPASASAPLELARPHQKSPPSTPRPVNEIDPGAQQAISNLIKHEHAEARRQRDGDRRARRRFLESDRDFHERRHGREHSALEIVEDILDLFD